ncbi:MAG: non-canonical purine NTP pyrophosphatase [Minisyncoccia bacterium]
MIYFITGNKGKFAEVKAVLGDAIEQLDLNLPEIQGTDPHEIVGEKLREAQKHQAGEFIVEDTSVSLEGMNGLPGPLIKWFLTTIGIAGVVKLAEIFGDRASARSIIGHVDAAGNIAFYEGEVQGRIVPARGTGGFGWDPIFLPNDFDKTFGEMAPEEKNQAKVSMRRMALEKLRMAIQ